MNYLVILFLLGLSALFSGLNLGLMSLGPQELKRKMELGDKRAAKIYPVRQNGNLLLVTLLLGNVAVNSTLSIFLDSLVSGVIAVVAATLLITVAGEILPQAFFSRFALQATPVVLPVIKLFMKIFYPIAKPLSMMVDHFLGGELPQLYSRAELVKILEEHAESKQRIIAQDEERIARGALIFGDKKVREVMTPYSSVYFVPANAQTDKKLISFLRGLGHSRFPVVKEEGGHEITGMLYMRDLTKASPNHKVKDLADKKVYFVHENYELDHVLQLFLRTKHHLFVVVNEFEEITGVVSIEDILEEIIGREIVGEFDKYADLRAVAKSLAKQKKMSKSAEREKVSGFWFLGRRGRHPRPCIY